LRRSGQRRSCASRTHCSRRGLGALPRSHMQCRCVNVSWIFSTEKVRRARCSRRRGYASCGTLTDRVTGLAIEVHRHTGLGLLESVSELCLCRELADAGIAFSRQFTIPVSIIRARPQHGTCKTPRTNSSAEPCGSRQSKQSGTTDAHRCTPMGRRRLVLSQPAPSNGT
jgi:hypothetical protein